MPPLVAIAVKIEHRLAEVFGYFTEWLEKIIVNCGRFYMTEDDEAADLSAEPLQV